MTSFFFFGHEWQVITNELKNYANGVYHNLDVQNLSSEMHTFFLTVVKCILNKKIVCVCFT